MKLNDERTKVELLMKRLKKIKLFKEKALKMKEDDDIVKNKDNNINNDDEKRIKNHKYKKLKLKIMTKDNPTTIKESQKNEEITKNVGGVTVKEKNLHIFNNEGHKTLTIGKPILLRPINKIQISSNLLLNSQNKNNQNEKKNR